ncbi:MAG TPA: patatin-like phospholipase family protein [Rubrivivax sp.]|nr:patatin-like phospholipase family protein [Rubrivivax sp.]HRY89183.1 patatin-like phospholipase family protein [Rubrivivax sp.]
MPTPHSRSIPAPLRAWCLRAALAAAALLLAGCGTLPRHAAPADQALQGTIPHFPDVRAWSGQPSAMLEQDLADSFAQESPADFAPGPDGVVRYSHLALSGGGANGAFGAGFLNGWTKTGKRPLFKIVTGVSTGALMAPFAFLGPDYDDALRDFYTTTSTVDIFVLGSMFGMIRQVLVGDALADTRPLQAMIVRHVDEELLRRVAQAHAQGRRLYIGTTNLDAPRFMVWNMGALAASGRPDALALFRKVMLASASIPVAFPPVFFDVELAPGGPRYDEMHVDGGVGARVFLNGGVFSGSVVLGRGGHGGQGREDIFVIHNGQLVPQPDPIRRALPQIAGRVISATGSTAAVGDLFRIFAYAQRQQAAFRWVTIPEDVAMAGDEIFDPGQMQLLYDLGYKLAHDPGVWFTAPPGGRRAD